jgi:hypothetical protein
LEFKNSNHPRGGDVSGLKLQALKVLEENDLTATQPGIPFACFVLQNQKAPAHAEACSWLR